MQTIAQVQNVHAQLVNTIQAGIVDAQVYFPFVGEFAKDMLLIRNGLEYATLQVKDGFVVKTPVRALQAEAIRLNREWFTV